MIIQLSCVMFLGLLFVWPFFIWLLWELRLMFCDSTVCQTQFLKLVSSRLSSPPFDIFLNFSCRKLAILYYLFYQLNHHAYWSDWIQILTARTCIVPNFFSHYSGASGSLSKRLLLVVCDRCLKNSFSLFSIYTVYGVFQAWVWAVGEKITSLFDAFNFKIF